MSMAPGFTGKGMMVNRMLYIKKSYLGIPNIKSKLKLLILSYLYEYQSKNASHYQPLIKKEAIMKS